MNVNPPPRKTPGLDQGGFTLIELMVALAISLIVLSGVLGAFTAQDKAYRRQNNLTELQQNLRVAVEFMSDDIQMAGYGAPNENFAAWYDWAQPDNTGTNFLGNPTIVQNFNGTTTDKLMIAGAFDPGGATLSADEAIGSKDLSIVNGTGEMLDNTSNHLVLIGRWENAHVTNLVGAGSTIKIDAEPAGVPARDPAPVTGASDGLISPRYAGEPVELVQVVSYYVLNGMLMRDTNDGSQPLPLIMNVEDFQVEVKGDDSLEITIDARTRQADQDLAAATGGDGYRRASVTFKTDMRNLCNANCF